MQRLAALRLKYPTLGRDKLQVVYKDEYDQDINYWRVRRIACGFKLYAKRAVKTPRERAQNIVLAKKRIANLKKEPFYWFSFGIRRH